MSGRLRKNAAASLGTARFILPVVGAIVVIGFLFWFIGGRA